MPLIRAIYPAVKQVTDFLLAERSGQFHGNRVVAVHPHADGHWSIGLVTSAAGLPPLSQALNREMVTVFIPSSPTAFSGYVVVVPRESVVELPMTVEEAMRLLISGGVITPKALDGQKSASPPVGEILVAGGVAAGAVGPGFFRPASVQAPRPRAVLARAVKTLGMEFSNRVDNVRQYRSEFSGTIESSASGPVGSATNWPLSPAAG